MGHRNSPQRQFTATVIHRNGDGVGGGGGGGWSSAEKTTPHRQAQATGGQRDLRGRRGTHGEQRSFVSSFLPQFTKIQNYVHRLMLSPVQPNFSLVAALSRWCRDVVATAISKIKLSIAGYDGSPYSACGEPSYPAKENSLPRPQRQPQPQRSQIQNRKSNFPSLGMTAPHIQHSMFDRPPCSTDRLARQTPLFDRPPCSTDRLVRQTALFGQTANGRTDGRIADESGRTRTGPPC